MTERAATHLPDSVPAPPEPIEPTPNILEWRKGRELHRVHLAHLSSTGFNVSHGHPSRFAPLRGSGGAPAPTLYAGSTRECAIHERIFRDVPLAAPFRSVAYREIAGLACSSFQSTRSLRLAQLFEPDLRRWGLTRRQLIDTPASEYENTVRWAQALHRDFADLDGLVWTSRLCDPDLSILLFGDRVHPSDLEPCEALRLIGRDAQLLGELAQFAVRTRILITR